MPTTNQPPSPLQHAIGQLLDEAIARVIAGEPLASFCAWFVSAMQPGMDPSDPPPGVVADDARRMLLAMARHFWRDVPMPNNRWRTQSLPKIDRNDRCYCGSGRKFKQCCADMAGMPPVLSPDFALGKVLAALPTAQLSLASLRQVPPEALAMAAMHIRDDYGDARRPNCWSRCF